MQTENTTSSPQSADAVFEEVKEYCRTEGNLSDVIMLTWLDDLTLQLPDAQTAIFTARNDLQRDTVRANYQKLLQEALQHVLGTEVQVRVETKSDMEKKQGDSTPQPKPQTESDATNLTSFEEVFEEVKKYCEREGNLSEAAMNTWIKALVPVSMDGKTAKFTIQSDFQRSVIISNYDELLHDAMRSVLGFDVDIIIDVKDEITPDAQVTHYDYETMEEKSRELEHSYEEAEYTYTFDTFIVGESNRFAHAACRSVAQNPGKTYNPLFIYGPSGLGKTHLMHAIAHEVQKNFPNYTIIYVTSEDFGNDLISHINDGDMEAFHDKYRTADLLLVDDIQFLAGKERMQEEFFHTFNRLHSENKQIVITSDKPPRELKTLEDRIRSRFEMGLIADISTPDLETRIAIIKRKAELLDLKIPDDVVEFIASRLKTNIRQLEGAVKKLKALNHLAGSQPSISMAQSVIRDILSDDQPEPVTVEKIINEVADVYGVTPEDIRSQKRVSQVSTARKVAIYVVREITHLPLQTIGTEFGGRDHSTIVYSINNVEATMAHDEHFKQMVEDIIKNIQDKSTI